MLEKIYDGQRYVCLGEEPYRRADGTHTELTVWESRCAECNGLFTIRTPVGAETFSPNRRCKEHRKPLKPVNRRKRSKKAA